MKIAVLSDIHSNVYALEAVIADAKGRGFDHIVNLGDILYGPIAPRDTYELLMTEQLITISGNQDRQIIEADHQELSQNSTMAFIHEDLGNEPIQWLASLPFDFQLAEDVYLCHGTPTNDLVYLLERVSLGFPQLRTDQEITSLLAGQQSDVILCGHTHTPRTVRLSTEQLIVNPGSVGLQAYVDDLPVRHSVENYSPHARYAMIEKTACGWQVEHCHVPYKTESAIANSFKRGRQDWVQFLATGRT